jgi:site-specific DNA-adenine methylase
VKPFFTYTGGKYRSAPRYPAPVYDTIVEPFAGSAGYSVRHHEKNVLLIDLDPDVAVLWEYLIAATPSDVRSLPLYDGTWDSTDDLNLSDGEKMLIRGWLNKGTFGKRPSAWMRSGDFDSQFWGEEIRERVASQVSLIKHWKIVHGSYVDAPDLLATWFIDPPYEIAGKTYNHGSSGIDYPALAEWCRSRPGQVIVCENTGAEWLPFSHFESAHAMQARFRSGRTEEAIWHEETM